MLSMVKSLEGVTQRLAARILGVSPKLIFKAEEAKEPFSCFNYCMERTELGTCYIVYRLDKFCIFTYSSISDPGSCSAVLLTGGGG